MIHSRNTIMLSEPCPEAPRRNSSVAKAPFSGQPRDDVTSLRKNRGTQRGEETHLPVDLPDGRSTTSYTLRRDAFDPRGSRRVFRKSMEKPRDSLRLLPRRLATSTFVALAAFIDGKSVADSRSKISVVMPEERCHLSCRHCRHFTWHMEEFVRRRKLDRCLATHVRCVAKRVRVNGKCNCRILHRDARDDFKNLRAYFYERRNFRLRI